MKHPKDFMRDILTKIAPKVAKGMGDSVTLSQYFATCNACKYHDHGPDKPCHKTKPAFCF